LKREQHVMFHARRLVGSGTNLRGRGGDVADGVVDLVDRLRNCQPEEQREHAGNGDEMKEHGCGSWHPQAAEPLDARPHRRRPHHPEQKEKDEQPEIPQRQRANDDGDHHEADHERLAERPMCA
jgi:hypothetical protein